ncbi:Wzz/FepE/Etk N-terminal domain-containing protein [Roseobacter sp. HKCCA2468]|uniref:Wzz/FepE/Etk N-terminal domain-containing protein n=1 Tax=Roseobacter sp. HKCCA2468 TaxID=3120342 RepID=UPI0030EB3FDA
MPTDQYPNDEIDLIELLQSLWDGKWLIGGVSAAALSIGGAYVALTPDSFDGRLELRPISINSQSAYLELNELDYFNISPDLLLNTFADVLLEGQVFIEQMDTLSVLNRSNYDSEAEYRDALSQKSFEEIKISQSLPPENVTIDPEEGQLTTPWVIEISGDHIETTTTLLTNALTRAEEITRSRLIENFEVLAANTERSQAYTIEDTETEIENAFEDYTTQLSDRLEFLQEQAQIARALNVARNTLEVNSFTQGTSILANVNAETPFYMRGYEAIEKEIDLLQSRTSADAFIPNLRELQTRIRSTQQDRTLERAVAAIEASPIHEPERFTAARYDIASLDVEYHKKTPLILALSMILGVFVGAVSVLIRGALRSRTTQN